MKPDAIVVLYDSMMPGTAGTGRKTTRDRRAPSLLPLTVLGFVGLGVLAGVALTVLVAVLTAFFIVSQAPVATIPSGGPTPIPVIEPAPTATPLPDVTPVAPEPTPAPLPGRRDIRLLISEPYLSAQTSAGIRASQVGAGFDDATLDIQPGNIIVVRARPRGSRDFALSFTGQIGLRNNRIIVTPLSSSLLLTPFRAQIAQIVEDDINARVDSYRQQVGFQILAVSTTESDFIVDLALRR